MKLLVTGGTGLIGRALVKRMLTDGHEVTVLTRQPLQSNEQVRYVKRLIDIPEGLDGLSIWRERDLQINDGTVHTSVKF